MGEDCGTWLPQLHFDWQSPNRSSFGAAHDVGKQNGISAAVNPGISMATRNGAMPAFTSPHLQFGGLSNAPHGWFYCLPRIRQGFTPVQNLTAEERLPSEWPKSFTEQITPNGESRFPKKQFLVVDQTGDQTNLIYSSRFGSPVECHLSSWDSKLHGTNNLNANEPSFRRDLDLNHAVGPILDDKVDENQGIDTESEMHEDTDEINALLYSDSDDYSTEDDDDDEVTSTGHSPSTMTTHDNQEPIKETAEEVASSSGKTKKRKLFNDDYDDIQIMDTACSLNPNRPFDTGDDDAESRCSSGSNSRRGLDEMSSLLGNKKMRKEKIQDVLSVLQGMIPGGKDKEPVELLNEAISCLKALKVKARALGFETFQVEEV